MVKIAITVLVLCAGAAHAADCSLDEFYKEIALRSVVTTDDYARLDRDFNAPSIARGARRYPPRAAVPAADEVRLFAADIQRQALARLCASITDPSAPTPHTISR